MSRTCDIQYMEVQIRDWRCNGFYSNSIACRSHPYEIQEGEKNRRETHRMYGRFVLFHDSHFIAAGSYIDIKFKAILQFFICERKV